MFQVFKQQTSYFVDESCIGILLDYIFIYEFIMFLINTINVFIYTSCLLSIYVCT